MKKIEQKSKKQRELLIQNEIVCICRFMSAVGGYKHYSALKK